MKKMRGYICILAVLFLAACGKEASNKNGHVESGFVPATTGNYDSADTAVVVEVNSEESTITLLNLEVGRQYTLNYDRTVSVSDKYGETMAMNQVKAGSIVDVKFMKSRKRLDSLNNSTSAWIYDEVSTYVFDAEGTSVTLGEDVFKLAPEHLIFSEGQLIDFKDLNSKDVLRLYGVDRTVYSIVVEKGHGYLSFANDEYFVGGWVEIGSTIVPIKQGMLITVPEGEYNMAVSHKGTQASIPIVVTRNEETLVDLGTIEVAKEGNEDTTGKILFTVTPADAQLYIDGELTDYSNGVILSCGIHQLIVKADGYLSTTKYIKVGSITTSIDVVLEEVASDEDEDPEKEDKEDTDAESSKSDSDDETSDNDATEEESSEGKENTSSDEDTDEDSGKDSDEEEDAQAPGNDGDSSGYLVYIDSPEQVEVYIDGMYIGLSPTSFDKKEGIYVVTLRKTGYQTRSYTIAIGTEAKDVAFSFAQLESISE